MKIFALCLAAIGMTGLAPVRASAATPTVAPLPAVVHIDQTVVVENGYPRYYHHHRYYWRHHRRYYWRHHRRFYD